MTLSEILAKAARGETLSEEERSQLAKVDINGIASAARKDAEEKTKQAEATAADLAKKLKAIEDAGKSELERAQNRVKELEAENTKHTEALKNLQTEKARMVRGSKLGKLFSNIKLVDGVDTDLARLGFEHRFSNLSDEDLDKEETTGKIVEAFKAANKAWILDDSGYGTGKGAHDGTQNTPKPSGKDPAKMTLEERQKDLQDKGLARK